MRQEIQFDLEKLAQYSEQIKAMIKNKLADLDAFMVTQYLRGELYVYIDFLLSVTLETPKSSIPIIYEFLKVVIKLIVVWLKMLPSLYISVCCI